MKQVSAALQSDLITTDDPGHAVHHLYQAHRGWLVGWLRARTDSLTDAEDLAQDTFCRLLRRPRKETLQQPRSYLSSIARGLVIDHYRRLSLERTYLDALALQPEATVPSLEDQALVLEALISIDRLLDGMPEKMRTIFLLSRLDGLTYREIATQLSISQSSVQKHMQTALKLCYLAQYAFEHDD